MGFSIGKVFKPIEEEMKKYAEVDSIELPCSNYSLRSMWKNLRAARKAVKSNKYDVIHITGTEHYLIPFFSQPVIVTIHDLGHYLSLTGIRSVFYYLLHILPISKADRIVCISNYTQEELYKSLVCDKNKVSIIPDAIGYEYIAYQKNFNADRPIILHIGTRPHKNLERSIEALKGIKCKLVIIGMLSDNFINTMNSSHINFINKMNLSDKEIIQEYINSDIVNFPSWHEGFGMPIIEAQAIGRVVVTSDLEPMKSVAGNGAILCNPFDTNSIREAYLSVIHNTNLRCDLVRKGFENVKKYRVKTICEQYFSIYKALSK